MNKTIYWIIWSFTLIIINMGAFPIALFSLFNTQAGTSIFSIDYLLAFSIVLCANIVSIQLFIATKRKNQKEFLFGLVFSIVEISSFILFIYNIEAFYIALTLFISSIIGASVLLYKSFNH